MKSFKKNILLLILIFLNGFFVFAKNYNVKSYQNYKTEDLEQERVLFILDFSNSMNEFLDGEKKSALMLQTMEKILPTINPNIWVGLRVYGQRGGFTQSDACIATRLANPIMPANAFNIQSSLKKMSPQGMTPITYALKKAVNNDFSGFAGNKHIILLTDGGENCDESPCAYVMDIIKYRKDIKIDVIAFNIDNKDDLEQLQCTSLVTSGKFYTANTAAELVDSLSKSLNTKKSVEAKIMY